MVPNTGIGTQADFVFRNTFTYTATDTSSHIGVVIGPTSDSSTGCYYYLDYIQAGHVWLGNDAGNGFVSGAYLPASPGANPTFSLTNSRCALDTVTGSATYDVQAKYFEYRVTTKLGSPLIGNLGIFAYGGVLAPYEQKGTWTVPPGDVVISPATASIYQGQNQPFQATVYSSADQRVNCGVSSGPGTISTNGVYLAPVTVNTPQNVTILATSAADGSKFATAAPDRVAYHVHSRHHTARAKCGRRSGNLQGACGIPVVFRFGSPCVSTADTERLDGNNLREPQLV